MCLHMHHQQVLAREAQTKLVVTTQDTCGRASESTFGNEPGGAPTQQWGGGGE